MSHIALLLLFAIFAGFAMNDTLNAESIEVLTERMHYTEGPAISPDGSKVWFTEAGPAHVIRVHPIGESESDILLKTEDSGGANGLFVRHGKLYVCEDRIARQVSVWTLDEDGTPGDKTVLASEFDGSRFNGPNDLVVDANGGVYFTDPNYSRRDDGPGVEAVYFIAPDGEGQISEVITDLQRPNGIGLSPDEATLYVADSDAKAIWAYDIEVSGKPGQGRLFHDVTAFGTPDGMTVADDGTLYIAIFQGHLLKLSSDGELLWSLETGPKTSNVVINKDQTRLYFTSDHRLKTLELVENK
jgi:gluconolactonase